MVRTRCIDLPTKLKLSTNARESEKYKRKRQRQKKIEEKIEKWTDGSLRPLNPEDVDQIEQWVDDDFERMDANRVDEEQFCNDLAGNINMAIEATGTRWYHDKKPLGRFFKSIREGNNEHNRTTIIIVRGGDETIYRLSVSKGKEFELLHSAISEGYIMSRVKISGQDR